MLFTQEELETLLTATSTFTSEFEGAAPQHVLNDMQALTLKIERQLLVGKQVRFTYRDEELVGELRGYEICEEILMAEIARKGHMYVVKAEGELLGVA